MARRQPFEPDPDFEYPLPYQLAQFLLGASDQLGQYTQGLGAQSKGASDVLESEARLDVSRDELRRRREESAAKLASRQQTNQFFQNLARQGPGGAMEGITDPANMDPAALKFALEHLIPKRFEPPATAAPGVGVYNPQTGQYDVKVPERPPATAAPGAGIYNPQTGQYDVRVPERPPSTAAPGVGIYNPATGQYDVRVPERPPATAAPGAGIYNPETGQYDVRVPAAPKEPPSPSAERDYHAIAVSQLGPTATPAALAQRVRELSLADQKAIAGVRADISLDTQRTLLGERDRTERQQKADLAEGSLKPIDTIITRLEVVVPKVLGPGFLGRVAGLTTRQFEEFKQTNPDLNELATLGQSYVSLIAKVVQGQTGVLSDQDVKRAEQSIPQVGDNVETATRKLEILREIADTAKQNIARLRGGPTPAASTPPPTGAGKAQFRYNPATRQLEAVP